MRLLMPVLFLPTTTAFVAFLFLLLFFPPADWLTLIRYVGAAALSGVAAAGFGYGSWRVWIAPRPARGDLWAYSDRVAIVYDGDSPRQLQARIDALRAQSMNAGNERNTDNRHIRAP
jgi:hypothetical protein